MMSKYVYGPVPSRRLGRSLGVDLVPLKTCSFNCVYCQLGPTPCTTVQRAEYVPVNEIVDEVRERLAAGPRPDYVTLSGSGEPTLHSRFGEIAAEIKKITDLPLALLTNGSLFFLPQVRGACRSIDLVIPSLDAPDERLFRYINRPHESLSLEKVVGGLSELRREFQGQIWLEVFLLLGVNSFDTEVMKLKAQIERIQPDRVQLNTAVRPPAEQYAYPVPPETLERLCGLLGPTCDVIAEVPPVRDDSTLKARKQDVLAMLLRRPCTLEDIARGLSVHRNEVVKYVQQLLKEGLIKGKREGAQQYYMATHGS